MADLRRVTDDFWVAPQLRPEDLASAREAGIRTVVCNRPEGEEPGQPATDSLEAAAAEAGLAFAAVPLTFPPSETAIEANARVIAEAEGPVLAFCKSGTRSVAAWAIAEVLANRRTPQQVVTLAGQAGYDISRLFSA